MLWAFTLFDDENRFMRRICRRGMKSRESREDYLLKVVVVYVAMFAWLCLYVISGFMVFGQECMWNDASIDGVAVVYSGFVSDIVADDDDALRKVGARPEPRPVQLKPSANMNVLITQNVMAINEMDGQIEQPRERRADATCGPRTCCMSWSRGMARLEACGETAVVAGAGVLILA